MNVFLLLRFALYKLPKIHDHPNENVQKGIAYLFVTSDTVANGWVLANDTILDENSIPARTLSVIIGNEVEVSHTYLILFQMEKCILKKSNDIKIY